MLYMLTPLHYISSKWSLWWQEESSSFLEETGHSPGQSLSVPGSNRLPGSCCYSPGRHPVDSCSCLPCIHGPYFGNRPHSFPPETIQFSLTPALQVCIVTGFHSLGMPVGLRQGSGFAPNSSQTQAS